MLSKQHGRQANNSYQNDHYFLEQKQRCSVSIAEASTKLWAIGVIYLAMLMLGSTRAGGLFI
jgi:hypothetical protein